MILLNLVFLAQSFGFTSAVVRTPYLVNTTTGVVLVEAEQAGIFEFQTCQLPEDMPLNLEDLNKSNLLCTPVTSGIQFQSQADHDSFKLLIAKDFIDFLKMHRHGAKVHKLVYTVLTATAYILVLPGAIQDAFGSLSPALKLALTLMMGSTALADFKFFVYDRFSAKVDKIDHLRRTIERNPTKPVTIYADDPEYFNGLLRIVKFVSAQQIKNQTLSTVPVN